MNGKGQPRQVRLELTDTSIRLTMGAETVELPPEASLTIAIQINTWLLQRLVKGLNKSPLLHA